MDLEHGETLWRVTNADSCSTTRHVVLFEGPAKVLTTTPKEEPPEATYTVEDGEKIFALRTTQSYKACAFTAFKSEHLKLVILPSQTWHSILNENKWKDQSGSSTVYERQIHLHRQNHGPTIRGFTLPSLLSNLPNREKGTARAARPCKC